MTKYVKQKEDIDISIFPFVEIDPLKRAPFCVDGRGGKVRGEIYGPYPQMLGGSLMPVVLAWLINQPDDNLENVLIDVFTKLKKLGYTLGIHTSTLAQEGRSDCGFSDNLGNILTLLKERVADIIKILADEGINTEEVVWQKIINNLERINLKNIPKGEKLIKTAEGNGALKQILDGKHQEKAAIVNLRSRTTLEVDNNQNHQAFNLDLWLIEEIGKNFGWEEALTKTLSLGLYIATEMVLVEGKGKPRLPILINQ